MIMTSPNNDPWTPIQSSKIQPPPVDPLHQMISSEQYIESLERKLSRLKGNSAKEPSAKTMIASLEVTRVSQMSAFMRDSCRVSGLAPVSADEEVSGSFLSRRLHPERQALNPEEVSPLLKEDELSQQQQQQEQQEEHQLQQQQQQKKKQGEQQQQQQQQELQQQQQQQQQQEQPEEHQLQQQQQQKKKQGEQQQQQQQELQQQQQQQQQQQEEQKNHKHQQPQAENPKTSETPSNDQITASAKTVSE